VGGQRGAQARTRQLHQRSDPALLANAAEMNKAPPSDAVVFFGATGDLAFKKIFPALQRMVKEGRLEMPVIGVSKGGGSLQSCRARAEESVREHGGGADPVAFPRLSQLLRYVDGDYSDPKTFERVREELGQGCRPLHYLAISQSLFEVVVNQLVRSGCAVDCRLVLENPFRTHLASP